MMSAFWSMLNRMLLDGMATAFLSSARSRSSSVRHLGQEEVERRAAVDHAVLQQQGQHLQQVRFARAEEAGDPDAIGALVVVVGVEKVLQALGDLVGQDVFVELGMQAGFVVGLDDAFDGAADRVAERCR